MKALALTTHSAHVEQWWRSFECLGHAVLSMRYDVPLACGQAESVISTAKPDVIIYFGGVQSHNFTPLSIGTLKALREIAPIIHICADSTQPDWKPYLDEYHRNNCFSVQVGIDGNVNSPLARYGLVLLMPQDPNQFEPRPWHERAINCSFVGNTVADGSPKSKILQQASERGLVQCFNFGADFKTMAKVMCDSKITFNVAQKGTYADGRVLYQVCGRVIEAAMAGSCLLEQRGSPTAYWFECGRDYLEYDTSMLAVIDSISSKLDERMADRFRTKVLAEHHPSIFWQKILWRAGIR